MKIKSQGLAIVIMAFVFGSIAVSSAMGWWKTTNEKIPATYKTGEFAGEYNPADIRGSYTFNDIYNAFGIPVEYLGKAFGVSDPATYAAFKVNGLEAMYLSLAAEGKEIGTGSVRYFVALYKGLPFTTTEATYLPKPAVEILKAKAKLTADQLASIEKYSVELPKASTPTPAASTGSTGTTSGSSGTASTAGTTVAASGSTTSSTPAATDKTIKGSTTFQTVLDWGVKREDMEKVINGKLPNTGMLIKDYATSKNVEFSTLRDPLQKLVDAVK